MPHLSRGNLIAQKALLGLSATCLFLPAGNYSLVLTLVGLVLVAWPLALAERALAQRAPSQALVTGLQQLTREADASRYWRVIAWSSLAASVLALPVIALLAGAYLTQSMQTLTADHSGVLSANVLWPALTLIALVFGVLRSMRQVNVLLWLLPVLLLLVLLVAQILLASPQPLHTQLLLSERLPTSAALLLGALAFGGGAGVLYSLSATPPVAPSTSGYGSLFIAALFYVLVFAAISSGLFHSITLASALLASVVTVLSVTSWAQPALAWLRSLGLKPLQAVLLLLVVSTLATEAVWLYSGLALLPTLAAVLAVWMALNLLAMTLFCGWVMKISHVRKALQLPSEGLYNLWRISARWLAPITLICALVLLLRTP